MGNFKEDIARCRAFVFDVDGVMTDGGIIPTIDGDFIRRYNAKDGYALAYAIKMGYKVCIISGGRGRTLEYRLRMLGVKDYYLDCMDKIRTMREYFAREGLDPADVIYMGDILRVVLRVAGSDDFVMKMRNTLGQTRLAPGQKIKVGWHPQDARALDPI